MASVFRLWDSSSGEFTFITVDMPPFPAVWSYNLETGWNIELCESYKQCFFVMIILPANKAIWQLNLTTKSFEYISVFEWRLYMFQPNWLLVSLVLPRSWTNLRKNVPYQVWQSELQGDLDYLKVRMIYIFISFRFLAERIIFPYFDTVSFIANQRKRKICYFGFPFLFPKGGREGMLKMKRIVRR